MMRLFAVGLLNTPAIAQYPPAAYYHIQRLITDPSVNMVEEGNELFDRVQSHIMYEVTNVDTSSELTGETPDKLCEHCHT